MNFVNYFNFAATLCWPKLTILASLFYYGGPYHKETSTMICRANQWTGFYIIRNSTMKELIFSRISDHHKNEICSYPITKLASEKYTLLQIRCYTFPYFSKKNTAVNILLIFRYDHRNDESINLIPKSYSQTFGRSPSS